VLFLDRSHARARAYIDRARSALAERQRESEELLQSGVAAFQRGDGGEARRLVQAAIDGGAPTDEALAILDRLNRLGGLPPVDAASPSRRVSRGSAPTSATLPAWSPLTIAFVSLAALAAVGVYSAVVWGPLDWRALFALQSPAARPAAAVAREAGVALPRRGELALTRARALAADGHLRDALTTLDLVQATDAQKADADRLRGEIQLQLIALTSVAAPPVSEKSATGDRPVP
jgi:hypothetical protein